MTGRLTQDPLENLFCTVRSKQLKPSGVLFKNTLKVIGMAQIIGDVSNGSYDEDDRFYLNDFLDIVKHLKTPETIKPIQLPPCDSYVYYDTSKLTKFELMALYNLAGHILFKIKKNIFRKCAKCCEQLGSKVPVDFEYSKLTQFKNFKLNESSEKGLVFPTEYVFNYFRALENVFNHYVKEDKFYQGNIRDSLILELYKVPNNFLKCHDISKRIVRNFVTLRLKLESQKRTRSGKPVYSSRSMN